MRIKNEFKKTGYFWLPSTPNRKLPGALAIIDGGDIKLEVIGLFDESFEGLNKTLNGAYRLGRVIGHIEEHGYVTLDDCFYIKQSFSFGGISKSLVHAKIAFIGVAYDEQEAVLFNSFQFSVEGIDEWVGLSGINVEYSHKEQATSITYLPPEEISLNLNNKMRLLITFSWTQPNFSNIREVSITQKTYFKLVSEHERSMDDFTSAAYKIATLLCFAIDKTVCIEQVSASSNTICRDISNGKTMPISISLYYKSMPYTKDEPNFDWHNMLFRYEQIKEEAERIVNNWFDAYDEIYPALNLYFSTKTGANTYVQSKFLALTQGLETYSRRTSTDTLMDEAIFKELTEELISQCPEDKQEWLSGRLRYGNEVNLGRRLKNIIEPFKEIVGNKDERAKLIRGIVDTRNYFTHYDKSLESKAIKGKDLWLLCLKIEAIFQLHFLQTIGFTQSEIKSIFENSDELKRKLQKSKMTNLEDRADYV